MPDQSPPNLSPEDIGRAVLDWFDGQARTLPWREAPCGQRDPYRVWLAEIMLQQTTVAAVVPYYARFIAAWPDVKALARADDDAVMRAWAGLGYYARARNMLKCARTVAEERQGAFPRAEDDLLRLPGVGAYTAAAVAAIAFNADTVPVDGNVIRTISRLYAIDAEMPAHKALVAERAHALLPAGRGGDFAEALMDLGATVCKPKNPDCANCPWGGACQAFAQGQATAFPKKAAKKAKPTRRGWAFWVQRPDGHVLLERRAERGLLGGMTGFPTTDWGDTPLNIKDAADVWSHTWPGGEGAALDGVVRHTFTHFHLELGVVRVRLRDDALVPDGLWRAQDALHDEALPTVMRKVAALVENQEDA